MPDFPLRCAATLRACSEAGLDYGGLMKEMLEEVVVKGFNADYGLFASTSDGLA